MDEPTSSKPRTRSQVEQLIECFCGTCKTFFKRKHVELALKANQSETLTDKNVRGILKKFIESRYGRSNIKSSIQEIIECFELCEAILTGEESMEERRYDLEDYCFTEDWEEKLSQAIDDGATDDFLNDLMFECSRRLGQEPEYEMFKEEMRKKLRK